MNIAVRNYKLIMPIVPCHIFITTGIVMFRRYVKATEMEGDAVIQDLLYGDSCKGALVELTEGCLLMVLPEEWDDVTVYHESLHAATRIWYDVGAALTVPANDEVLAYTQGYIASYIKEVCYERTS